MKDLRIGIDIGGTNTEFGIVNSEGRIIARDKIPTEISDNFDEYAKILADSINMMILSADASERILGVGIGAPAINPRKGVIEGATDLPWNGILPIKAGLENLLNLPISLINDANAAAAGEFLFGAAKGIENFIMLTLGTGVGAGIMTDGHLLSGRNGYAGELGHTQVPDAEGRICSCGRKDCLQTYASASGVVATARNLLESSSEPSLLRNYPADALSPKIIAEAAMKNDPIALQTWRLTGKWIGKACDSFATFSDPEAIFFFGGVAKGWPLFKDALVEEYHRHALHLYKELKFIPTSIADADAAILGAAAAVD